MISKNKFRREYYSSKARLSRKLQEIGISNNTNSYENDKLPIVQKYKENPEQYVNKLKSYINDQEVTNSIRDKKHTHYIVNDLCAGNTNLFISIVKNKNHSVHDIPNENGKKRYNKNNNL